MENENLEQKEKDVYDFLIVGGGAVGLAAAMYSARLGMKTIVFGHTSGTELPIGGVITTTNVVENYPGFQKISGRDLAKKIEDHARDYDLVTIKNEKVEEVKKEEKLFLVKTKKDSYFGKTILFATGTKWKQLPKDIEGSREFENKGISYCALCDGFLYKGKNVAVIGGADSAAKDALLLSEYAKKVYMIYRKEKIRPEPINYERIMKSENIEVINNTNIKEIKGDEVVKSVILDKPYEGGNELKVDGIFVSIGHEVLSEVSNPLGVEMNEKNEIVIDHKNSKTNIEGVFAAGDVTDKPFKQLITGVADGCTAAYFAYDYIKNNF